MPSLTETIVTFQCEPWAEYVKDARGLWPVHYKELALDQDKQELSIDEQRYEKLDSEGALHICTVRDSGQLVGYYISAILRHLHYNDAGLMSYTDLYYLLPEYRAGGMGAKWMIFIERSLRDRGVAKAYLSCKLHQDHGRLFELLGWKATDTVFTKWLGK